MRPLDGLVTTRTGSRCSRVGPAVTTTFFPCHGARCSSSRSAAARMASGSLIRPGRSLGPSARGPVSGPTRGPPRATSPFRLAPVPGWAHIASFIAGAARPGPGQRRASAFLAPPPHQLVREPAAHHLVQCARGELLLEVHRAVARELVHETGELGSYEHPQILVLGLRGHFARGHDPHHLLLPVDCFSGAASLRSCRTNSDSKLATSRGARCATSRPPPCTRSMTSRTARSRSSFTSTWSYTSPSSRRAVSTSRVAMSIRCDSSASDSVRRLRSRSISTRGEGGITNSTTEAGRGYAFRTCRAPLTSTSSTTCLPLCSTRSTSLRSVPYSSPAYSVDSRNSPASRRRSNSSRVRKWYASPSRSPGLALRVVADTEYPKISGSRVRSSRAMVVLPPPDGAASTTTRGVTPGCRAAPETSRARLSWR